MAKPKTNTLQAALNDVTPTKKGPEKPTTATPQRRTTTTTKPKAQSRTNTVLIAGHFPPQIAKQLRFLAVEEETTNQALLEEALHLLFLKKNVKNKPV